MRKKVYIFIIAILITSLKAYSLSLIDSCSVSIVPNDTIIYTNNPTLTSIQLNATQGAHSYKWTPSTGLDDDTISNPIATLSTSSQYIVEATFIDANIIYI